MKEYGEDCLDTLSLIYSEWPLQSIVSMGSHHPIPYSGLYRRDRFPPLDLLQWIYHMERDRRVRAADITFPAKHKVLETPEHNMTRSLFKPQTPQIAFKLHQTDVVQKGWRSAAENKLPKTKSFKEEVDRKRWSLPSHFVKDVAVTKARLSDSSDPTDEVSREVGVEQWGES